MKQTLRDYGINLDHILIMCDNLSAINLSKNPIQHRDKISLLRGHVQKVDITLEFISTEKQLANNFIKLLSEDQFVKIRHELGMMKFSY